MPELTPEGKLLDVIKKAQDKLRFKKELKLFTKINIILIGLIIIIIAILLMDTFIFDYEVPEVDVDLPVQKEEVFLISEEVDEDIHKDADIIKEESVSSPKEEIGKNLLIQWGIGFKYFGEDKRYEKVWEKGKDKPDIIITYKGKSALVDWKAKRKPHWLVNKRAIDSYLCWSNNLQLPAIICFFVFDGSGSLKERRFAFLGKHNYIESEKKQWDKNITVEFDACLPEFNKENLIKYLL